MLTILLQRVRHWRIERAHRLLARAVALNERHDNLLTRFKCEFRSHRYARLLLVVPRYWQAGAVGGGTVLKFPASTCKQVENRVSELGGTIAYVDSAAGFIAYHPKLQK